MMSMTGEEEYELLKFLDDNEGMEISQIVEKLGWEQKVVRDYVSMLEKKGLVRMNEGGKICINEEVGIRDMLNLDEIDPRALKDFNV